MAKTQQIHIKLEPSLLERFEQKLKEENERHYAEGTVSSKIRQLIPAYLEDEIYL